MNIHIPKEGTSHTPTSRILHQMAVMANQHDRIWKLGGPRYRTIFMQQRHTLRTF